MNRFIGTQILFLSVLIAGCSCGGNNLPETKETPRLKVNISEKVVDNKPGSFDVYVSSNTLWTVTPQAEWLSANVEEWDGSRSVTISFEGNYLEDGTTGASPRNACVTIAAEGVSPVEISVKQGPRTFKNPIFQPLPDPYVIRHVVGGKAKYYVCKSTGSAINLGKSDKLTDLGKTSRIWKCPSDGESKVWNRANLWAPELHYIDGAWYIYYAAGRPSTELGSDGKAVGYNTQRTGVLRCTASDPTTGAWEDLGMIFTGDEDDFKKYKSGQALTADNTIYAIDMTVFKIGDQLYAIWSGNVSKTDGNQRLYIATMSNPWTIDCARVELSRPDYSWEKVNRSINEGPSVIVNPQGTKLFCAYSANGSWTKDYRIGWLELDLTDPAKSNPLVKENWTKTPQAAFWRCDDVAKSSNPNADNAQDESTMNIGGVHGVGHNTFTKSPDGTEDWIVYHTKRYKDSGWDNRDCFIQKFTWKEDGTPDFGKPVGWQEAIEVPSGEPL